MGIPSTNSVAEVAASGAAFDDTMICHECEGCMVRAHADHHLYRYNNVQLTLKHLPCWRCTDCGDEVYGAGTLRKHLLRARELYDTTGETVYDCL